MDFEKTLKEALEAWDERVARFPGPIPDSLRFLSPHKGAPRLVISFMIHGNEVGSLPGVLAALQKLEDRKEPCSVNLDFVLGNRRAALLAKRFTEQDLNRVFLDEAPESYEKNRAQEIQSLIEGSKLLIDFHQTIEACEQSFYIFAFDEATYLWAKALGASQVLVTRKGNAAFAAGCRSIDEYGILFGVPSITLELGQKGFDDDGARRTEKTILKSIELLEKAPEAKLGDIRKAAENAAPLRFYKRILGQSFSDASMSLKKGLKNFQKVQKGEKLGHDFKGELQAPSEGYLLFPKYPPRDAHGEALDPRPTDLYLLLEEADLSEFTS